MKKMARIALSASLIASLAFPVAAGAKEYKDIPEDFWAKDAIDSLSDAGIFSGYENGTFQPNAPVKRSQAATILTETLDLNTSDRPDPEFSDVDTDDPFYQAAAAMADEGFIKGKDGKFMPNAPLTRAQMAKILAEAYDFSGEPEENFTDIPEDHWAYDYVGALAANGITSGYQKDQTFRPNKPTTRAQFATFIQNAIGDSLESPDVERDEEIVQLLQDTMGAQLNLETYAFDGSISVATEIPMPEELSEDDQELFTEASQINMDIRGTYQKDPFMSETVIEQEIPTFGETMVLPSIATEGKSYQYLATPTLMGYPEEWQDMYIETNVEELLGEDAEDLYNVENQQEMMKEIYNVFLDHYGTAHFELLDDHADIPEGTDVDQVLKFEFSGEDLSEFASVFEEAVWPELVSVLQHPQTASALGLSAQEVQKLDNEAEQDFEAFLNNLRLNVEIYQAINEENYIEFDTGTIAVDYNDGNESLSYDIQYTMDMNSFHEEVSFEYNLPGEDDEVLTMEDILAWQEEQMEQMEEFEDVSEKEEE